jgi:hypothetical protein
LRTTGVADRDALRDVRARGVSARERIRLTSSAPTIAPAIAQLATTS